MNNILEGMVGLLLITVSIVVFVGAPVLIYSIGFESKTQTQETRICPSWSANLNTQVTTIATKMKS